MASTSIRVLLADDHAMVREALGDSLSRTEGFQLVALAADGREAVRLAREARPDVAVLELFMPNLNGVDAFWQMVEPGKGPAGVLFSGRDWDGAIVEGLRIGVRGFVPKMSRLGELVECIRVVARGGVYVSPSLSSGLGATTIADALNGRDRHKPELTPREREVLQLIAEGRTTKEIAQILFASSKTVEHHRERLMAKLDIHSVAGLTRYAVKTRLVVP